MPRYVYRGNPKIISAIEGRIADAGFTREGEVELADFVLTYCTNATELEELYFGDGGLTETMNPGAVAVDMSPCAPNLANEISAVCTISDINYVSAPMIVKNKVAEEAYLRVNMGTFVGGEGDSVAKAMKFLEAIFGDIGEVDNVGTAQLARAASTIQSTAEIVSAIEAVSVIKACKKSLSGIEVKGYEPEATSPSAFFIMNAIRSKRFKGDYTVEMMLGELSAAMMCADDYEMIIPQTEAAFHLLELLAVIGGSDMSPAALALVYEGNSEHSEGPDENGLDWSRAEHLYGDDIADDFYDEFDDDDWDDDEGLFDEEDYSSGFGYSVN